MEVFARTGRNNALIALEILQLLSDIKSFSIVVSLLDRLS